MINQTVTWKQLLEHQQQLANKGLKTLFTEQPQRANQFFKHAAGLSMDFSKNHLTEETLALLIKLTDEVNLAEAIDAMFSGKKINNTEDRAVLHTALRNSSNTPVLVDGQDIMPEVNASLAKMKEFCHKIHSEQWRGFSGKPIKDIVNIGIGGSDLGPQLVVKALRNYHHQAVKCHFIANIDPTDLVETLENLEPDTTLFIISSKSFTTEETLTNARAARDWLLTACDDNSQVAKHFVAVSANPEKAKAFGINTENVFAFWDWVGGRYSLWSAIGLPIALSIGFNNFARLLDGAHAMDQHFRQTDFKDNLPVLLALIGVWYRNFFNTSSHAIIPYAQLLSLLPSYLQQLDMESNGKQVTKQGEPIDYKTGPVIWGGCGTNGQHAFHQLLHQGTDLIPIDFIIAKQSHNPVGNQQTSLYAHCLAQAEALLIGRKTEELYRDMPGNRPSTTILMDELTPQNLGSLIALYEHKVFVQGVIWGLNSFDQWGVELGKQLAKSLLAELLEKEEPAEHDSSTENLIKLYQQD